ncbi:hypothetical protein FVA95_26680 [Pseudonocardia sp. EV170527-09]|uniref:hypothetical protein n=1 Tax=Pseudonocardia sp. EV170527-09 TaxID=2603411 RepID=UPI0011F16D54|nr:hypothetical protein [Pseudonocardia sp. EV170527-09]KAA1013928.1 hypothetical protein FVA95_26680 [Pseudonocardia sp. EV170527-09]
MTPENLWDYELRNYRLRSYGRWGDDLDEVDDVDDGLADEDLWTRLQVLVLRVEGLTVHETADFLDEDHDYIETLWARSEDLGEWNKAKGLHFAHQLANSHQIAQAKKDAATWPQPTTPTQRRRRTVALYERGLTARAIADLTGDDIVDIARHLDTAARRGDIQG